MRKLLIAFAVALAVSSAGYATKLPDNVKEAVTKDFPNTNFRFDGVIILPDNTVYLPLIPAKLNPGKELTIKTTYPSGKTLAQKPDVVIFDNDYVLLKVLVDSKGQKSIAKWQIRRRKFVPDFCRKICWFRETFQFRRI